METKRKKMSAKQILLDEQLGSPISEGLSSYLKTYTTSNDRANVSIKTGVGSSTIRDVTYRNNNLTEDNSRAIVELVKIAITRCEVVTSDAQKAKADLETMIRA